MTRKQTVTIVGPGSLGGAIAVALFGAGYPIREVVFRTDRGRAQAIARKCGTVAVAFEKARFAGDIVWICVGDRAIEDTASSMQGRTDWKGKFVFHSSGALSADELSALKRKGAAVAAVHPMMSFVRAADASFNGVSFALQGDASAVRAAAQIARVLGGISFEIKKKDKPLYHALGAFSSPLLVAQLAMAERIGRKLGLSEKQTRQVIGPMLQKTLQNYLAHGAAAAFSGPIMRGDVQTIGRNMEALVRVPGAAEIYRALAKVAAEELPVKNPKEMRKVLK